MDHAPRTAADGPSRQASRCRRATDHAGRGTDAEGPVEASGTARLPQAEGMMPGLHFDLGGGWMGMAHGYLWGVYTDQTGPRGDDKALCPVDGDADRPRSDFERRRGCSCARCSAPSR